MSKCELEKYPLKETERFAQKFGPGGQSFNAFTLQKCRVSHGAVQKSK